MAWGVKYVLSQAIGAVAAAGIRQWVRLTGKRIAKRDAPWSVQQPAGYPDPCVKVSFPLPLGSSTVFLRPEAQSDGSFNLISSGWQFGDTGFYRMVEVDGENWRVRYLRTLREFFHVYVDKQGTLRTEHRVRFLGLTSLRLHYKLERVRPAVEQTHSAAAAPTASADAGSHPTGAW